MEVENEDGETKRFRIVGYDEIFGRKDYSIDAPMARALLKRSRGRRHRQYAAGRGAVVRERDRLPGSFQLFPNRRQRRRLRSSPRGGGPLRWHFPRSIRITVPCLFTVLNTDTRPMNDPLSRIIATELQARPEQVDSAIRLLDEVIPCPLLHAIVRKSPGPGRHPTAPAGNPPRLSA